MLMWSWKIVVFAKTWPFTSHNWVKCCHRTETSTTIREYSSRVIRCFFPLISTTLSFERRGGSHQLPSLHVRVMKIGVHGRGLILPSTPLPHALSGVWTISCVVSFFSFSSAEAYFIKSCLQMQAFVVGWMISDDDLDGRWWFVVSFTEFSFPAAA